MRIFIITLAIFCLTPILEQKSMQSDAHTRNRFIGKEFICAIDLGDDMYNSEGLQTGFNYELINRFAKDNRCKVKIITTDRNANYIDSLRYGKIDVLITNRPDTIVHSCIYMADGIQENLVWAVSTDDKGFIAITDQWISHTRRSPQFNTLKKQYIGRFNPHTIAEKGLTRKRISPYDELFRKYAEEIGWDWRLIAAIVYQESKFSINSKSPRGALGLMQVMPGTGLHYGVEDLENPEKNIQAGTSHLKRLKHMCEKWGLEQEEVIKFTLASYNAGEGRIIDCRTLAASKGYDNTKWDEIVKVIPMMRDDSILSETNIRHGKFQGNETINYIESVMSHYDAIRQIHP